MRFGRALVASWLVCFAHEALAQQHRADAVLLVNSASPQYADAQRHVRPFLDHFGVPYTVLDLATASVGADIGSYALIVIGHPGLDTTGTYLDSTEQQNLTSAVAAGTGLVSFDHDLASGGTGRYSFVQQIFGFGYAGATSGEGVVFTLNAPEHYVSSKHAAGSAIALKQVASAALVPAAGSTVLAQFADTGSPFLVVKSYGLGRAVQWGSSAWMSPQQHRFDYQGPLRGLDDLVWRGLAWAARKPFVMQGLPNFVTMRVDDAQGVEGRTPSGFWWAQIANEFQLKPWLGTFYEKISGPDSIVLANLVNSGNATTSVHGTGSGPFFYFDHFAGTNYPDATVASYFAAATTWHTNYNIPISTVVIPHFYEIGTNVFSRLQAWGVRTVSAHMAPGLPYEGAPWNMQGPFRLSEAGSAGTAASVTYADYLSVPGHPEFANQFFNCVTEIRDDVGYEWAPDATSVSTTIGNGTRQTVRALDSMALATLFTHEYYIQPFTNANWRAALAGITANLAPYNPVYVTLDYACEYLRAKHDTKITSAVFDSGTGTLSTQLSGRGDVATKFLVFTETGGFVQQAFWNVPVFAGTTTVSQTLPPGTVPTLSSISVTPANPTIIAGATRQFLATATYSDGSSVAVTSQASWSSSNTTAATVNGTGLATGAVIGSTTISATLSGITGSTTLTVQQAPLVVTSTSLPPAAQRVAYTATLTASGGIPPYAWSAAPGALPTGLALAADGTVSGTPTSAGSFSFLATVTDSTTASASATVSLVINSSSNITLWPASVAPGTADHGPDDSLELGVKFHADVAGALMGLRFYKSAANTGMHVGNLWTSGGVLLASAPFTGETASGWQEVRFATPVAIAADTTYVASYHTDVGHYALDAGYFTAGGWDATPLHAPAAGVVGGNGVYGYGASSSVFPSGASPVNPNYWVDVVFSAGPTPTLDAIAITPPNPSVVAGASVQFSALGTFSDGGTYDISGQALWQSLNSAVATVSFLGLASAVAPGTTTISARVFAPEGLVTGSTSMTVTPLLASVVVSPATARLVAGASQQFTAAGLDAQGNPIAGLTFTWSTTGGGTIGQNGVFTAGSAGGTFTGNVIATTAGVGGAASTETLAVSSVALAPSSVVGGSPSTGTVTLSGTAPSGGALVALSSDTPNVTVPASVTLSAGALSATFPVATTAVAQATTAALSASFGTSSASATLAVAPPTLVSLSLSPAVVIGGGRSVGTLTFSSAAAVGTTVTLASNDPAAAVPATVSVPAGATSVAFSVVSSAVASNRIATISATYGAVTRTATLGIAAAVVNGVSFAPTGPVGGTASTATITLSGNAPTGGVTVALGSDSPAATVPATVLVPSGWRSVTFTVTTFPVASDATANISASLGATATAALTVRAPTPAALAANPTSVVGGTGSTGTVTLTGPAPSGGLTVTLSSNNAAAQVPATVTVAAGATTATFPITTSPVTATATSTLSASYGGATSTATFSVLVPGPSGLTVSPRNLIGGASAVGTVTLSSAATGTGVRVNLSSSNIAVATVPRYVTVPAGATTVTFTITTFTVTGNTSVTIKASNAAGTRTTSIQVRP